MTNLKTRLEILEKKLFHNNEDVPSCIIICSESARLDSVPDESEIVRLTCGNKIYDREPGGETEEAFIERAAEASKALLPSPSAVPVIMASTENMLQAD